MRFVTHGSATILFSAALAVSADTVYLRNGCSVKGEILKKKADRVVVDLGFQVVEIPVDEVDRIVPEGEKDVRTAETDDLWRTAPDQSELTVKENIDRCAPAVVLVRTPVALGTGFVVHPSGYVITNDHVVAGETRISVTAFRREGQELTKRICGKVRIVATNPHADLALLAVEEGTGTFQSLPIGDSNDLQEGQTVFAIGNPLGLEWTVSEGIVSKKSRALGGSVYIQTTAAISPGNSGGPLLNLRGEVVGVTNMKITDASAEGLGFAIPAVLLKDFLRNRGAFAFDPRNPNAGFRYGEPPRHARKKEENNK